MRPRFPGPAGVSAWRKDALGRNPFRGDAAAAAGSFFRPAARLCRAGVPAEKKLPASLPAALRRHLSMSLRFWQVSQEITEAFVLRGKLLPGMDMPMTLNFAMALGNYARFFLFRRGSRLPRAAALKAHAAFCGEMEVMPSAMAARRALGKGKVSPAREKFFARHTPEASALRLAAAFGEAFGKRGVSCG